MGVAYVWLCAQTMRSLPNKFIENKNNVNIEKITHSSDWRWLYLKLPILYFKYKCQ